MTSGTKSCDAVSYQAVSGGRMGGMEAVSLLIGDWVFKGLKSKRKKKKKKSGSTYAPFGGSAVKTS